VWPPTIQSSDGAKEAMMKRRVREQWAQATKTPYDWRNPSSAATF
jgi:hypothetical protein